MQAWLARRGPHHTKPAALAALLRRSLTRAPRRRRPVRPRRWRLAGNNREPIPHGEPSSPCRPEGSKARGTMRRAPVRRPLTNPRDAPRRSRTYLRARHARTRCRRCRHCTGPIPASPTRARVEPRHLALGPRSEARHPRRMACRMSMSPSNPRASAGQTLGVGGADIEVVRDAAVGGEDRRELASWVEDGGATVAAAIRDQLLPPHGPARRHFTPAAGQKTGF